jgi:MFS family permease
MRKEQLRKLKEKSRHLSVKEGSFATIRQALGDTYIAPFAIALNAGNATVAMLSSITGLLGPISQIFSARLIEKHSRKKILLKATFYEALFWIPFIIIAILFHQGILVSILPFLLLFFFTIYTVVAQIPVPAWFSWTGDIVDEGYRGKWFAKRNYIVGIISLIFTILAALFLDFIKKQNLVMLGFMILFFLAMIARFISRHYFKKAYEPKLKLEKGYYFSFWQFIRKAHSNNFGRFAIYRSLLNFAAAIASPFFAVYMLRNLGFSYITFMAVVMSQVLFTALTIRIWGKFADKYGNYEVIKITAVLVPLYPILWLFSNNVLFLILGPSLIGGIAWSGLNLATGNFIFDSVSPQKRSLVVSYFHVLMGIGVFLGAGLGGILAKVITISFMDTLLFIFLISAFVRMITGILLITKIKEVRKTERFDSSRALKNFVFGIVKKPSFESEVHHFAIKKRHKSGKK